MGELLDRHYQHQLLRRLQEDYPQVVGIHKVFDASSHTYVNLAYLEEHELVSLKWQQTVGGPRIPQTAMITAKGMDFLADDGGLSAILGVVTIKIHQDTLRQLLIARVEATDEDPSVKKRFIDQIKALPSEALGIVSQQAMQKGIESIPNILHWLTSLLS